MCGEIGWIVMSAPKPQQPQEVFDLVAAIKESLRLRQPAGEHQEEPAAGSPEAVEQAAHQRTLQCLATEAVKGDHEAADALLEEADELRRQRDEMAERVWELEDSLEFSKTQVTDLAVWKDRLAEEHAAEEERLQKQIIALGEAHRELARALEAMRSHPVVSGLSARIRNESSRSGIPNPLDLAEAALSKAGRLR
jgi:hypothetical protein